MGSADNRIRTLFDVELAGLYADGGGSFVRKLSSRVEGSRWSQVVRALDSDGNDIEQSPSLAMNAPPISSIDARDWKYVFYSLARSIYRWPKPVR